MNIFDFTFYVRLLNFLILLICCVSLIYYRKKLGEKINFFIIATLFVALPNIIIFILKNFTGFQGINTIGWIVIPVNIIGFLFFLLYFNQLQTIRKAKLIQDGIVGLFCLNAVLFVLLDKDFFTAFPKFFYFIESVLLLLSISLFFYETFNTNIILNLKKYFPFWVSLSLIVIYVGLLPLLFFADEVGNSLSKEIYFAILLFINITGYSILLYGIRKCI